jgi:hypothetical protein
MPIHLGDQPLPRDPVIEAYKKDVDRTLLRENLKFTHEERLIKLQRMMDAVEALREAGRHARRRAL